MKKVTFLSILILVLISFPTSVLAGALQLNYDGAVHKYTGTQYKLQVNGKAVPCDVPPVVINKSTLIPVRAAFESLGATLRWNAKVQQFDIKLGKTSIELKANSTTAKLDGKAVKLDAPAKLINDRLSVPATFFSRNLKMAVGLFPAKGLVTVDNSKTVAAPGKLTGVKYSLKGNKCDVLVNLSSYKDYQVLTLPDPDRIVLDITNVQMADKPQKLNVGGSFLKAVRYSQLDSKTVRVVLDTAGQLDYQVVEQKGQLQLTITAKNNTKVSRGGNVDRGGSLPANSLDVLYTAHADNEEIAIVTHDYKGYSITMTEDPARILVTIPGAAGPSEPRVYNYNGKPVQAVVVSQLDRENTQIAVHLSARSQYQVSEEKGRLVLWVGQATESSEFDDAAPPSDGPVPAPKSVFEVRHGLENGQDNISILAQDYSGYQVYTLEHPHRIVVDIPSPGSSSAEQKISTISKLTRSVRYARFSDDIFRVVIDTTGLPEYEVIENQGQLTVRVKSCKFRNIDYRNVGDRVCLLLANAKLTEGGQPLTKLYTESYDSTRKVYTLSFPSSNAALDNEVLQINDSYLESIVITKDAELTSITFYAKDAFVYNVFSRSELKDTAITLLKPVAPGEQLVVIDPGHGGSDPGAVHAGVREKDLNLDIALKLNTQLRNNNIKTYILREDDSFLGLYERANIANALNASLFISIHNNAYTAVTKGTETLYNFAGPDDGSFSSKKLAQFIQTSLIMTLGTADRKIVYRPNLVVLKGTVMPAALVEIGFITNTEDRANLLKEDFRQKSADAICEGILQAIIAMMGKS